ncbi:hypothetical protein KXX11_004483, partial [Aspergillus fumigatus]
EAVADQHQLAEAAAFGQVQGGCAAADGHGLHVVHGCGSASATQAAALQGRHLRHTRSGREAHAPLFAGGQMEPVLRGTVRLAAEMQVLGEAPRAQVQAYPFGIVRHPGLQAQLGPRQQALRKVTGLRQQGPAVRIAQGGDTHVMGR